MYDEARRENMTEEERNRFSEHDLTDMWTSYSQRDPFAARLRNLGIAVTYKDYLFNVYTFLAD